MRSTGTFTVASYEPVDYTSPVTTGIPVGQAQMTKEFTGGISGQSATQFCYAFDPTSGVGTYVAMEAFEGSIDGRSGAFAFAHSSMTDGRSPGRLAELLVIAPGSGYGGLAGISGRGRIVIDAAGTHTLELDYELAAEHA